MMDVRSIVNSPTTMFRNYSKTVVEPFTIFKECIDCGQTHKLIVDKGTYQAFMKKELPGLVQDYFSYITPDLREMLISGYCGTCYEKMFPEEEY